MFCMPADLTELGAGYLQTQCWPGSVAAFRIIDNICAANTNRIIMNQIPPLMVLFDWNNNVKLINRTQGSPTGAYESVLIVSQRWIKLQSEIMWSLRESKHPRMIRKNNFILVCFIGLPAVRST